MSQICRRLLRTGLLTGGPPPPPTVRRAGLYLLTTAAERDPQLQPALLGWLRQLPPADGELQQLPEKLRRPGGPLARLLALLDAEAVVKAGGDRRRPGAETDRAAAGGALSETVQAGESALSEIAQTGEGDQSAEKAPASTAESSDGGPLSSLLETEAAYLADRRDCPLSAWLSVRPQYRLALALSSGRPLAPLAELLWSSETGSDSQRWPELHRLLTTDCARLQTAPETPSLSELLRGRAPARLVRLMQTLTDSIR